MRDEDKAASPDRAEVERALREALAAAEDTRSVVSEFDAGEGSFVRVRPPLSEVEHEVAVALNVALELVNRRGKSADERDAPGLFEARVLLMNEISSRGLPQLARGLWEYEHGDEDEGR